MYKDNWQDKMHLKTARAECLVHDRERFPSSSHKLLSIDPSPNSPCRLLPVKLTYFVSRIVQQEDCPRGARKLLLSLLHPSPHTFLAYIAAAEAPGQSAPESRSWAVTPVSGSLLCGALVPDVTSVSSARPCPPVPGRTKGVELRHTAHSPAQLFIGMGPMMACS